MRWTDPRLKQNDCAHVAPGGGADGKKCVGIIPWLPRQMAEERLTQDDNIVAFAEERGIVFCLNVAQNDSKIVPAPRSLVK